MKKADIFKRRDDISWKIIEDRAVLVDDAEGKVFQFDTVATEIWICLDGHFAVSDVIDHLTHTFEVSLQQAEKDALSFINRLSSLDLVIQADC